MTTYKLGAALQPLEVAPAPNGDVWFTGSTGSRRRADRAADGERPRPDADADADADPHARRAT